MGKTIVLFGLGDLGQWFLEFTARCEGVNRIIAVDKRKDWGIRKVECAAIGASMQGYYKHIEFREGDVFNIDQTAEFLQEVQPDLIYNSTTLQSWAVAQLLPEEPRRKYELMGGGPMAPTQLLLIYKIMQAVKQSGIKTLVLNNSFPDVTNPILWKMGLGPDVGAGNSDHIVERIRWQISQEQNIRPQEICIYFFTAHQICMAPENVPFYLKVVVSGNDITSRYNTRELVSDFNKATVPGAHISWLRHPHIAACAVKNVMAMLNDTRELSNAPGPNGLPGGYTVRLGDNGAEVALPDDLTLEQAIQINKDALKFDGVEEIKDDGTLVCTDEACKVMKDLTGYDAKECKPGEIEDRAKQILADFRKLAEKYKSDSYASYL